MKLIHILAVNTLLTSIVIGNAFSAKKQFYPSVVYLTQNKPSVAILGIEVVLCLMVYFEIIKKLFLGDLFPTELERLREQIFPSLLETCFAFSIFDKNKDYLFYFRLFCLFCDKSSHYMAKLRVGSMSTAAQMSRLSHIRFIGLLLYLGLIDVYQITSSAVSLRKVISFEMLFLFEYSILLLNLLHISGEYMLECVDQFKGEAGWEDKVVYSNYLDLVFTILKSMAQIILARVLFKLGSLPLFMIKYLVRNYEKINSCVKKIIQSFKAIRRMDEFPNPTAEDLLADSMCTICRDQIETVESAKKLYCSHKFHIVCLKAWFRRQQSCPTCRLDVIRARPVPVARNPVDNNGRQP